MPYTYILDDSIKSPTLILTAHRSTLLFLPGFFLQAMVSKKSILETSGRDWLKLSIIYNYWIRPSPNPP